MGQKVNPNGLRLGINKTWNSQWYADKENFSKYIVEDKKIRDFINKNYSACSISKVVVERTNTRVTVYVYASKVGMLIGVKGAEIEKIKGAIAKITNNNNITVNVREVKNVDLDATLVAQSIATQLEKRISPKRAAKMAVQKTMKAGAKGIKVMVSGRLGGAEIARSEQYHEGSLPLHTIRADIDYGTAEAHTTFGVNGVKVWIYHGEILTKKAPVAEVYKEGVAGDVNA